MHVSLPFLKSIEEYLYNSLAKEKGFTSISDIEYFFENDICNIK
jgi:hypothetical protein